MPIRKFQAKRQHAVIETLERIFSQMGRRHDSPYTWVFRMDIYSHQDRPQHTVVAFIYIHIYQKEIFLMTIDDRLQVSCNISNEICNHPLASSFFVFRNQNLKCYKYSTKRLQSPFASFVCLDMETSYGSDSPFVISIQFCWTEQ